ncbi:hypothetical protein WJX75_001503 [Coccomyxa subellipsoidea]|uniref:Adhesion regulating molecule n=1 Tax=Coccomyxa subellipsoidea TaxID=248742 RepID=A0ABR2YUS7_9CHLO
MGKVEIIRDGDNMVHLTWTERISLGGGLLSNVQPEMDCLIIPGTSASCEQIPGRRVWVVKYEQQQYFFWAQDPDTSQDHVVAAEVTERLNATPDYSAMPVLASASEDNSPDEELGEEDEETLKGLLAGHLAKILGSIQCPPQLPAASASSAAAAPAAPSSSAPAVDARALAAALGSISSGHMAMQRAPVPNLAEVLTPEVIIPLLRQPGVLERLAPHLPEEHRNEAALMDLAASAQLRHQLSVLGAALQTAQLDPSQFGLAPTGYTVADFLESIQKKVDEEGSRDGSTNQQA